jgi:multiple sugar transport system substrate-binding protein
MRHRWILLAGVGLGVAGCGGQESREPGSAAGKVVLQLWHSQKQQNEAALADLVARFNESSPHYEVQLQNLGSYSDIFKAVRLRIESGQLPDLCVLYESMVAELMEADVVLPLDDALNDPEHGLRAEDQADLFPFFIASNRLPQFGNKLLSFPFTKSLLMLYYNAELLRAAGHERPPATWPEFLQQCRDVKAKTGQTPLAFTRDPSTFGDLVLSLGGQLVSDDGTRSLLDSPEAVQALELLATLVREDLLMTVPIGSDDDRLHFANGRVAFLLRSSTSRSYMRDDMVDKAGRDRFDWRMACPPVGEGQPKRQRGAWEFIRFFISPAVTAEWAARTGYLPVRRSAAEQKVYADVLAEHPRNRATFDTIPCGVREPNAAGWQAVRDLIRDTLTRVCKQQAAPAEAARELARLADAELQRRAPRNQPGAK